MIGVSALLLVVVAILLACAAGEGSTAQTKLSLLSDVFSNGDTIPERHTAYGDNESPPLRWTGAPGETRSFALVLEDPDAHKVVPYVHWLIYNIPGEIGVLDPGLPKSERLNHPPAAMQGLNSKGEIGYFGPKPPSGDPPHRYEFKLYALDDLLTLKPGIDREALLRAIEGHVLASGVLVGTYGLGTERPSQEPEHDAVEGVRQEVGSDDKLEPR